MKRFVVRTLAALLVVGAGLYYWYFIEGPDPGVVARFEIDMEEVRRLAHEIPGAVPREIRFEHVMDFKAPRAATITGGGWSQETMWGLSYQLIYPDGHSAIIDTALDEAQAKAMTFITAFYKLAYDRMIATMRSAGWIVITHEHPDHIGGLASHTDAARLFRDGVVKLNEDQIANPKQMLPAKLDAALLNSYHPLSYKRMAALAPGVVLIRSPGHTPGSQIVYVRMSDGVEVLFLGDVVWLMGNVMELKGRPRAATRGWGENREQVMAEIAGLNRLAQSNPRLHLIPGHDAEATTKLVRMGVLREGFEAARGAGR